MEHCLRAKGAAQRSLPARILAALHPLSYMRMEHKARLKHALRAHGHVKCVVSVLQEHGSLSLLRRGLGTGSTIYSQPNISASRDKSTSLKLRAS